MHGGAPTQVPSSEVAAPSAGTHRAVTRVRGSAGLWRQEHPYFEQGQFRQYVDGEISFWELDLDDWTDRDGDGVLWDDADGDGKVDTGESDENELNAFTFHGAVGATLEARVGDPLGRRTAAGAWSPGAAASSSTTRASSTHRTTRSVRRPGSRGPAPSSCGCR